MSAQADVNGSILIVEDDEVIRRAMQMVLEWEGYQVACVANGQEALDGIQLVASGSPYLVSPGRVTVR